MTELTIKNIYWESKETSGTKSEFETGKSPYIEVLSRIVTNIPSGYDVFEKNGRRDVIIVDSRLGKAMLPYQCGYNVGNDEVVFQLGYPKDKKAKDSDFKAFVV